MLSKSSTSHRSGALVLMQCISKVTRSHSLGFALLAINGWMGLALPGAIPGMQKCTGVRSPCRCKVWPQHGTAMKGSCLSSQSLLGLRCLKPEFTCAQMCTLWRSDAKSSCWNLKLFVQLSLSNRIKPPFYIILYLFISFNPSPCEPEQRVVSWYGCDVAAGTEKPNSGPGLKIFDRLKSGKKIRRASKSHLGIFPCWRNAKTEWVECQSQPAQGDPGCERKDKTLVVIPGRICAVGQFQALQDKAKKSSQEASWGALQSWEQMASKSGTAALLGIAGQVAQVAQAHAEWELSVWPWTEAAPAPAPAPAPASAPAPAALTARGLGLNCVGLFRYDFCGAVSD